jgi:hypothetical protein
MSGVSFTHDVFLSHIAKDKAVVRPLAERLRKDGLKVWFDEWEIRPGDSIPAKIDPTSLRSSAAIEGGLERSRVLACPAEASVQRRMLCMSANAFGSDWAQLASPAVASLRRRKAGTFRLREDATPGQVRFRDPLNRERRFIPLRLDAAHIKGSLAQFLYINWCLVEREQEGLKAWKNNDLRSGSPKETESKP